MSCLSSPACPSGLPVIPGLFREHALAPSGLPVIPGFPRDLIRNPKHVGQMILSEASARLWAMPRVVHFEIQADDPSRAQVFYTEVFGWRFDDYSQAVGLPYWGVITGDDAVPGINGGLTPRPAPAVESPGANAFVCTIGVDDYDACESRILRAGGLAGVLPRHRGQHLRYSPTRRERPLTQLPHDAGAARLG